MKTKIGTYTATGARFQLDLGESSPPSLLFVVGEGATPLVTWSNDHWCERANGLSSIDSFRNGIQQYSKGVTIGTSPNVNTNGVKYYWAAIWNDGADDFEITSHMGNATTGRTVDLSTKKQILATIIKRDSTRQAIAQIGTKPTAFLGGGAPTNCVTLGEGVLTLTAQNEVNEYNSAGGLGEGIVSYNFFNSSNCKIVQWSGTPASGSIIPVEGDPLFSIIMSTAGTSLVARFLTRDMPTEDNYTKPVDTSAITINEAALVTGGIRLGSSSTLRTSGEISAIVFCRQEKLTKQAPSISIKSKKAIYFPGRGTTALVDCGTSDTLSLTAGAYSVEWHGVIMPTQSSLTADATFITRGVGPAATTNAYSWGLGALHKVDNGWSGPQITTIVSGQYNDTAPLDTAIWRSGVLCPFNKVFQIIQTYDGTGKWKLYVDGKLMQQRAASTPPLPTSTIGHHTVLGARPNGVGAFTNYQRMMAFGSRLYNKALSPDEVYSIYSRDILGSSTTQEVTSGLVEQWDANNATNTTLPANVLSVNNGVLSGGARIITL